MDASRIRSDHGQGFDFRGIERQHGTFVLEQYHGFPGGAPGERPVRRVAVDGVQLVGIGVGILEQAANELHPQHAPRRPVEIRQGHAARPDLIGEGLEGTFAAEIIVEAGRDRQGARLGHVGGGVVVLAHDIQAAAVAHDEAAKAPFAAQDVGQQLVIQVVRDAVPLVVGGHDRLGVRLPDRRLERDQVRLPEFALRVVHRRDIPAALGLAVPGEMFQRDGHVVVVDECAAALEAVDGCHAEAGDEVGILAITLVEPAPARIAGQVEHGREHLAGATRTGLKGGHGEDLFEQAGIPRATERDGRGETGGAGRHVAVHRLSERKDGDAQTRFLAQVFLNGVGSLRPLPRRQLKQFFERHSSRAEECADAVIQKLRVAPPDEVPLDIPRFGIVGMVLLQLRRFLLQTHAGQEIVEPPFDRQRRVLVDFLAVGVAGEQENGGKEDEALHEPRWIRSGRGSRLHFRRR